MKIGGDEKFCVRGLAKGLVIFYRELCGVYGLLSKVSKDCDKI